MGTFGVVLTVLYVLGGIFLTGKYGWASAIWLVVGLALMVFSGVIPIGGLLLNLL
jgi:hypothetical protein